MGELAFDISKDIRAIEKEVEKRNPNLEREQREKGLTQYIERVNLHEITREAFAMIKLKSPVDSGDYQNSLNIWVDGKNYGEVIREDVFDNAKTVFIWNYQPYTRMIWHGSSLQVPNGLFQVIEAVLKSRYNKEINDGILTIESDFKLMSSHVPFETRTLSDGQYPGLEIKIK